MKEIIFDLLGVNRLQKPVLTPEVSWLNLNTARSTPLEILPSRAHGLFFRIKSVHVSSLAFTACARVRGKGALVKANFHPKTSHVGIRRASELARYIEK